MASRPEDRYVSLTTKTLANGKVVYNSARPINIDPSPTDITVTADETDRMDVMANNVYGEASDWWRIAAANKRVNGTLHLPPGAQIVIPQG
jgi:hypothetical protein